MIAETIVVQHAPAVLLGAYAVAVALVVKSVALMIERGIRGR